MRPILLSKTGMLVYQLLWLVDKGAGLKVIISYRGFSLSTDSAESLQQIYGDVHDRLAKIASRKTLPKDVIKAHRRLDISDEED